MQWELIDFTLVLIFISVSKLVYEGVCHVQLVEKNIKVNSESALKLVKASFCTTGLNNFLMHVLINLELKLLFTLRIIVLGCKQGNLELIIKQMKKYFMRVFSKIYYGLYVLPFLCKYSSLHIQHKLSNLKHVKTKIGQTGNSQHIRCKRLTEILQRLLIQCHS